MKETFIRRIFLHPDVWNAKGERQVRALAKQYLRSLVAVVALVATFFPAHAEVSELRVVYGLSIGFLPLVLVSDQHLLEKYTAQAGLPPVPFIASKVSDTATAAQALLSGSVSILAGGVPNSILLWDRTGGKIKSLGALSNMPMMLNTRNPNIKTLRDFTPSDKIAVPGVKTSIQALVLQMAAEKVFGEGKFDELDSRTVTRSLAQGSAEMLSGKGDIGSNFASSDYSLFELKTAGIHTVVRSEDILGGSSTYNTLSMSVDFPSKNPKVYKAFNQALDEAMEMIAKDKRKAVEIYKKYTESTLSVEDLLSVVTDPAIKFSRTPENYMKYAKFLRHTGVIENGPASWKDLVFPELHALAGS